MKPLNPILHNPLRLAIMSLLVQNEEAGFNFLLEKTGATRGNISVQLTTLEKEGYITIHKTYKGKRPYTYCSMNQKGFDAMEEYTESLRDYLDL